MEEILKILSAGGDTAVIALVFILWRFHERLLRLEIVLGIRKGDEKCSIG